jgi:ion channel-forming bestrophin family protein
MIVRDRPHGLALFFVVRGSVLQVILPALTVNILFSVLITHWHGELMDHKIQVTTEPFSLIGLALAIFLGFRNRAAYDRYWEARKLWGDMVHATRSWARQVMAYVKVEDETQVKLQEKLVLSVAAMSHALRHQLRSTTASEDVARLLGRDVADRLEGVRNLPAALLQDASEHLGKLLHQGKVEPQMASSMEVSLSRLAASAAGCERIAGTPIPFTYTLLLHRTAYVYCFLLPFGLVDLLHGLTPVVVGFVAYTFFGLDALGDEIEDPFGMKMNHLPLSSICATIETSMREALGERHLPPPPQPVDYLLH